MEFIDRRSGGLAAQSVSILCLTNHLLTASLAARSLARISSGESSHAFGIASEMKRHLLRQDTSVTVTFIHVEY